ncbi:MAG: hypothetical protein ABEJ35_01245 [Halobacteriaceae archaeon]
MVNVSPVAIGFLVVMLGFILFVYFFLRRTIVAFREGKSEQRERQ